MIEPIALHPAADAVATDLARAIRDRAVSAREVMQAHLDQIARHNPAVTAIVSLRDPDMLLAEAEAADRELAERGPRGPLCNTTKPGKSCESLPIP